MGAIKLLAAPIRSLLNFPLFQLAAVIAVVLLLQAADDNSVGGRLFSALDRIVEQSVRSISAIFSVKSFTRSWLTTGFWIAYVYLACLLILFILRVMLGVAADVAGRWNVLWLRNAIARERGIAAYRAWLPFERIRPATIPQQRWEEAFAWPANDRPPYLPLAQRIFRGAFGYLIVFLAMAALLQTFSPFPVLTWLGELTKRSIGLN